MNPILIRPDRKPVGKVAPARSVARRSPRGPEPSADTEADGAVVAGPVVANHLRYEVTRWDDQPQVDVLVEEVRPRVQDVAVAGQGAVATQGSLDVALDVRPALGVDQGVGGLDAGGDLGGGDVDGRRDQQQNEEDARSPFGSGYGHAPRHGALFSHSGATGMLMPGESRPVLPGEHR